MDEWADEEIDELVQWAGESPDYHVVISNPKFELFLVMHYERANGCTTASAVDRRLKGHWAEYGKRISASQFGKKEIETAIDNAQARRVSCKSAKPDPGMTDVYLLADRLLRAVGPGQRAGHL